MKGYLQRLATHATARAANSGGRIHPLVASIYSATKRQSAGEFFRGDAEQLLSTPDARTKTQTPAWSPDPRDSEPPGNVDRESLGEHLRAPQHGVNTRFQPLMGQLERAIPSVHPQDEERVNHYHGPETSTETGSEQTTESAAPSGNSQKATAGESPGDAVRSPREVLVRDVAARESRTWQPAQARRQAPPAPTLSSVPASRGPDEIQINIGRIEVTAVSQAAPLPARPARKSLDLGEYLKRRDGRAG
jgi:hypothetical protein